MIIRISRLISQPEEDILVRVFTRNLNWRFRNINTKLSKKSGLVIVFLNFFKIRARNFYIFASCIKNVAIFCIWTVKVCVAILRKITTEILWFTISKCSHSYFNRAATLIFLIPFYPLNSLILSYSEIVVSKISKVRISLMINTKANLILSKSAG